MSCQFLRMKPSTLSKSFVMPCSSPFTLSTSSVDCCSFNLANSCQLAVTCQLRQPLEQSNRCLPLFSVVKECEAQSATLDIFSKESTPSCSTSFTASFWSTSYHIFQVGGMTHCSMTKESQQHLLCGLKTAAEGSCDAEKRSFARTRQSHSTNLKPNK